MRIDKDNRIFMLYLLAFIGAVVVAIFGVLLLKLFMALLPFLIIGFIILFVAAWDY